MFLQWLLNGRTMLHKVFSMVYGSLYFCGMVTCLCWSILVRVLGLLLDVSFR